MPAYETNIDEQNHHESSPLNRPARGSAWVHGEKAHGTLDVTGDAAAAIAQSNEVPKNHRPQRVPRIGKYFRRHIKKPTRRLKPPKGKVIDGKHEQYTLSYTMQLGIQRSVEYAHSACRGSPKAIVLSVWCRHYRTASRRRV